MVEHINSHLGNIRTGTLSNKLDYFAPMIVRQYGKQGATAGIKTYNFVDAFPVDVSPIDLNWGDNDSIEEFTITFAYQYWISNTTDGTLIQPSSTPNSFQK